MTTTTSPLRTNGWRIALVLSGAAMLIGGPRHPQGDAHDSLTGELLRRWRTPTSC
ncbi:hypothetical protein [Nocardioides bigeumensis]|uniref:Uncharacterized protein n=1 Tax=Nocardioides bigeumensis TaxID=433657 RepID=A0ABN2YCX8_9ACTN